MQLRRTFMFLVGLLILSITSVQAQEVVVITDSAGREVSVPVPLERVVVLTSPVAEIMRALDLTDSIVGISGSIAKNSDFWPELHKNTVVASSAIREPDYEKIITLHPQLVITYGTHPAVDIEAIAANLAPAGIPVLGIDCYKFDTLLADIERIGTVFQAKEQAAELTDFLAGIRALAVELTSGVEEPVAVYAESHANEFRTYAQGAEWHSMLGLINARNIFSDAGSSHVDIDPELVLTRNPSVVIKDAPRSLEIGHKVTETQHLEAYLASFYERTGWDQLQAAQEKRIYVVSSDLGTGPGKFMALLYLGKIIYPDLFQDVDPEDYLRKYYQEFQQIPFEGIFIYPEVANAGLR